MLTTQLSSKGQIVIPKPIRIAHHWTTGMEFLIQERKEGVFLKPKNPFPLTHLEEVLGCVCYKGPPKTLITMEKAVAREAKKHK